MARIFLKKLLQRILDWLENKSVNKNETKIEVPRNHKIEVRRLIQPHVDKRIEMGAIADPFGSCLAVVDNLIVVIEIMTTRFNIKDEQKRKIDQIQKNLNLSKRKFIIMISDRYAEQTYGKDLDADGELVAVYKLFDDLRENDWAGPRKRDIYLEEWALDMKKEIDESFKELMRIANSERVPVQPILYNSMSPDVKIKKVDPPPPPNEDDDESDYSDGSMPF